VLEQNGYDLWNQHPSISLKRIFWSLQFTKNRKFEICEIDHIAMPRIDSGNFAELKPDIFPANFEFLNP
jgi:hypothetical protein